MAKNRKRLFFCVLALFFIGACASNQGQNGSQVNQSTSQSKQEQTLLERNFYPGAVYQVENKAQIIQKIYIFEDRVVVSFNLDSGDTKQMNLVRETFFRGATTGSGLIEKDGRKYYPEAQQWVVRSYDKTIEGYESQYGSTYVIFQTPTIKLSAGSQDTVVISNLTRHEMLRLKVTEENGKTVLTDQTNTKYVLEK